MDVHIDESIIAQLFDDYCENCDKLIDYDTFKLKLYRYILYKIEDLDVSLL